MGSADVGRYGLWLLRGLLVALPVVVGFGLGDTLDRLDHPLPAEMALWAVWFAGLVASGVPGPVSLTALRILSPAVVALGVLSTASERSSLGGAGVIVAYGLLVSAVAFLAAVGDTMINGSAYGSERRMALRPPGYVLFGPVQLGWLLAVVGAAGPVLLAVTGRWIAAAILLVPGLFGCWLGWRILHQLARRWLVFVPAGFVIHDHLLLVESILMRRTIVDTLGPATQERLPEAVDLSGRAPGLALEVALSEPVQFGRRQRKDVVNTEATNLVFTPTMPGAVLREARIRAIRIGQSTSG